MLAGVTGDGVRVSVGDEVAKLLELDILVSVSPGGVIGAFARFTISRAFCSSSAASRFDMMHLRAGAQSIGPLGMSE